PPKIWFLCWDDALPKQGILVSSFREPDIHLYFLSMKLRLGDRKFLVLHTLQLSHYSDIIDLRDEGPQIACVCLWFNSCSKNIIDLNLRDEGKRASLVRGSTLGE